MTQEGVEEALQALLPLLIGRLVRGLCLFAVIPIPAQDARHLVAKKINHGSCLDLAARNKGFSTLCGEFFASRNFPWHELSVATTTDRTARLHLFLFLHVLCSTPESDPCPQISRRKSGRNKPSPT